MASKGILGRKLGMTQVWDADNRVVPVTVIQAGPCRVVQLKTPERDGYAAVQLAFGDAKPARLTKPELGHLKAADAAPAKHLAELRVDDLSGFEIGQVLKAAGYTVEALLKGIIVARQPDRAPATATTRSTARPAPSAPARRPPACSRGWACPASTATAGSPPSTSRSSKATPSAGSSSSEGPSPARPAAWCSYATR